MLALTRWNPMGSAFRMHREIDDLFSRFFGEPWPEGRAEAEATPDWLPAIETYADGGKLGVRVALAGVDPKDVEVTVTDDVLTIKGERKVERTGKEGGYLQRELAYGTFQRTLTLPEGVDPSQVRASYANGMLEVTVPAPVAVAPKRVEIKIESGEGSAPVVKAA